jgi:hypothetical protein
MRAKVQILTLHWYKSTNTDAASTCSAMNAAELPEGLDALTSLEELYLGHNLIGDMKLPDGG